MCIRDRILIDTQLFLCGMNFALRSGQEHRSLKITQIELVEPPDASPYLIYTEKYSKNSAGGLSHRKVEPTCKRVVHHVNEEKSMLLSCSTVQKVPRILAKSGGDCTVPDSNQEAEREHLVHEIPIGHNTLQNCWINMSSW